MPKSTSNESNNKLSHSQRRRGARLAAVQALYQMDVGGEPSTVVIDEFRDYRYDDEAVTPLSDGADSEFFEDIIKGVIAYQETIDVEIAAHLSKKWSIQRMDLTLRAILRAASYEIMRRPDIPALVIIDEYVSVTADFFDAKEPGFVNGALDNIAKKVRAAEFGIPAALPPVQKAE